MTTPRSIGRYEILAKLAHGGMAEILLARMSGPSGFQKPVVLKRILPHLVEEPSMRAMFVAEARTAAQIRHPNVAQVYELGEDAGEFYLAMEYLDGESAASLLRRSIARSVPLPHGLAAFIAAEIAAGLQAAHDLRSQDTGAPLHLVHRDVSPQNVFVTYGGAVKLLDFGIAKTSDSGRTKTGNLRGKIEFMSPEQSQGLPLDRTTDLFALGAVLYELTTSKRLYARASPLLTFDAICNQDVVPPHRLDPDYPEALSRVCVRALARDRARRYESAAEMRRDLLAVVRALVEGDPAEQLAARMHEWFDDRIVAKEAMLRSVREGVPVEAVPPGETDVEVEVQPGGSGATMAAADDAPGKLATTDGALGPHRARRWWVPAVTLVGSAAVAIVVQRSRTADVGTAGRPGDVASSTASQNVVGEGHAVIVDIDTDPAGARVTIGGVFRGETPLTLELASSNERVELAVERDGHEPVRRTLVADRAQRLFFTLPATSAAPSASTAPPTAVPRRASPVTAHSPATTASPPTSATAAPSVVETNEPVALPSSSSPAATPTPSSKPFRRFE